VLLSFIVALTSGILFAVRTATGARSGVPGALPFGLIDAEDGRRAVSASDCTEFCLALTEAGLVAIPGAGEPRPGGLIISGNVLRMGEDANDGDIAVEVTVLFLFLACPFGAALGRFFGPSGAGVALGLPALLFVAVPLLPNTPLKARSIGAPTGGAFSTFRLLEGGFTLVPAPFVIPRPTPTEVSAAAAFLTLLLP